MFWAISQFWVFLFQDKRSAWQSAAGVCVNGAHARPTFGLVMNSYLFLFTSYSKCNTIRIKHRSKSIAGKAWNMRAKRIALIENILNRKNPYPLILSVRSFKYQKTRSAGTLIIWAKKEPYRRYTEELPIISLHRMPDSSPMNNAIRFSARKKTPFPKKQPPLYKSGMSFI